MTEKNTLRMVLPLTQLSAFFPLLQQGVWLRVQVGCSVIGLLADQFGINEKYITERITTLFLDGKAIDDANKSYIKAGSTVALSSAMPGLVGATMRRGGHLAAMRGAITHQNQGPAASGTGDIKIKLFNMVMAELAGKFLAYGVRLSNAELGRFLDEQEESFWLSFGVAILGDQQIDPANLKEQFYTADPTDEILLKVEFMN